MQSPKYFFEKWYYLFYYFGIYSFLGWILEKIVVLITFGELSPRGFIYGPFCIIYGSIAVLLIKLFEKVESKWYVVFSSSTIIVSSVEYLTGFLMECIFHKRWWDYSNIPYNFNGYICLRFSIAWGLISLIFIYIIHPFIKRLINRVPNEIIYKCAYILTIFFIADFIFSFLHNMNIVT